MGRSGSRPLSRRAFAKSVGLSALAAGAAPALVFARQSSSLAPQVEDRK